jgi:RNA-binding protein
MPSSPLRRSLRAAGHHLAPVVQVGKEGVTEALLRQLDRALLDHELVKVKAGTETPEDRFGTADALLAGASGAQLAQILGRTLLLYRRHAEKPRFEPLRAERRPKASPPERRARPERQAGPQRSRRPERTARPERRERPGRRERPNRGDRPERKLRPGRPDRVGRPPPRRR